MSRKKNDERLAIFWCSMLEPILFGDLEGREIGAYLRELASEERRFPDGAWKKPSVSTLRRKLAQFRTEGFEGLYRKRRSDRGKPRAHPRERIERAIALKRDLGIRSHGTLNDFLEDEQGKTIPRSTLYRHLRAAGATRLKLGVEKIKVRRRFTHDHTHDLWVGDFEHGPYVIEGGAVVRTRLSAFIDCHSRYLIEGRYYVNEDLDILIDSLLRAFSQHGAPKALYVDNAKVYHSHALRCACAALHIRKRHRKKGDPAPGGLIERFFETAQSQFESEVRAEPILTLDKLNRAFDAWLEIRYHDRPHSETKQPPRERYQTGLAAVRHVDMARILPFFFQCAQRTVHKTFSDIQLHGRFYRVDPKLRGDRIEVRFDPYGDQDTVWLYSERDEYLGKGVRHHREEGVDLPPDPQPKVTWSYLDLLMRKHEQRLCDHAKGIDFRKAVSQRRWPFPEFATELARALGRGAGLSDLTAEEIEVLRTAFERTPALHRAMVLDAVARAESKTIPAVLFEIQKLPRPRKETP